MAIQTRNLNRTLSTPFEANFQSRQIDACAATIRSATEIVDVARRDVSQLGFMSDAGGLAYGAVFGRVTIPMGGYSISSEPALLTDPALDLDWPIRENTYPPLFEDLAVLQVYSSEETQELFEELGETLPFRIEMQWATQEQWRDDFDWPATLESATMRLSAFLALYEPLRARCLDVMRGTRIGPL